MNSDQWNKWLTLGANIGVFVGLILVAYEINQSARQLEIAASADGTDNFTQAMEVLVQDEGLSSLIYRAENVYDELDEFDKWRVTKYLDGFMSMSQQDFTVFHQVENVEETAAFRVDWQENMSKPVFRDYWQRRQSRFGMQFREFIDEIIEEQDSQQ